VFLHAIAGRSSAVLLVATVLMTATGCKRSRSAAPQHSVTISQAPAFVPKFALFELSLRDDYKYRNAFIDVSLEGEFIAPDGARTTTPGFYYGEGRWMVRFRPHAPGRWNYTWDLAANDGFRNQGQGSFQCTLPEDGKGRIRSNPANPYRWVFDNGEPYFPIGLQEGTSPDRPGFAIDGEGRAGPRHAVSVEEYFRIYGRAGFNLFRFSQRNSTYPIFDDLDHYRERESIFTDRLLDAARRNGMRVMFGFFGSYRNWAQGRTRWEREFRRLLDFSPEAINRPYDSSTVAKEQRFVRYCVARWGAYADFWELLNEREASDAWTNTMAAYVHSIDPDHKPVSTSWERPGLREIDVNAPHWYESESELESDLLVQQNALQWKRFGKPVIVGEQGNGGMNWDPGSALRMRIRAWTALFQEIGLIFWNTSWSKAGVFGGHYSPSFDANIYLGPEERRYIRVLNDFAARLDTEVRIVPVSVYGGSVRAYALLSPKLAAVYLHHYGDHTTIATGVQIKLSVPKSRSLVAQWIDPASGEVLARTPVHLGDATLLAPPLRVDVALLVTPQLSPSPKEAKHD
jgi:hypothetical protein